MRTLFWRRSQSIAYVPNRLAPLDSSNKLVALAGDANRTNYAGIAFCADTGTFMAVQEHRPRNTTRWGSASLATPPSSHHLSDLGTACLAGVRHSLHFLVKSFEGTPRACIIGGYVMALYSCASRPAGALQRHVRPQPPLCTTTSGSSQEGRE